MANSTSAAVALIRAGLTLGIVLLAACPANCGSGTPPQPTPPDPDATTKKGPNPPPPGESSATSPVNTVEIVPSIIHSAWGAQFSLVAIARDVAGTPVGNPGPATWSPSSLFSDATANPALFTAPTAGSSVSISVAIAGHSARASVELAPTTALTDNVSVAHNANDPAEVLLIDANETTGSSGSGLSNRCQEDLLYTVAGIALLNQNLSSGCTNRIAVFAVGHPVRFECQQGATRPTCTGNLTNLWTNGVDAIVRNPAPLPALGVELVIWDRATTLADDVASEAIAAANIASGIYRQRRAGIAFSIRPNAGGSDGSARSLVDPDPACENAEQDLGFTAVAGTVNVVYVDDIVFGEDASVRGLACERTGGGPRILIVAWNRMVPSTLSHELAHLMGLMNGAFADWRGGHTIYLDGFDQSNLMWSQENATVGLDRDNLSLGQVYRMHVDDRSWLNVKWIDPMTGVAKSIRTGDMEKCQTDRDTSDPCPRLRLDPGVP